jgi:hypothetical protein
MRHIAKAVSIVIFAGVVIWSALALWFDGPRSRLLAATLCAGIAIVSFWLAARVRPYSIGLLTASIPAVLVMVWWVSIAPSTSRDWTPDVARTAGAVFRGSSVTVRNVRNFEYRGESDYDQHWEVRTYDLDAIRGFDLFLSYWGPTQIAHTIASWEFEGGQFLAVSIETRKESGESYSALRGFFRQYELHYVFGDERDLIGVRANFRGEKVYLYRIRIPVAEARSLLIEYLNEANRLAEHPQWYNALAHNCTTAIRGHGQHLGDYRPWDWRLLLNGHLDQLLYERGQIDTSVPFNEVRARSDITARAAAAADSAAFSTLIREAPGLRGAQLQGLRP